MWRWIRWISRWIAWWIGWWIARWWIHRWIARWWVGRWWITIRIGRWIGRKAWWKLSKTAIRIIGIIGSLGTAIGSLVAVAIRSVGIWGFSWQPRVGELSNYPRNRKNPSEQWKNHGLFHEFMNRTHTHTHTYFMIFMAPLEIFIICIKLRQYSIIT